MFISDPKRSLRVIKGAYQCHLHACINISTHCISRVFSLQIRFLIKNTAFASGVIWVPAGRTPFTAATTRKPHCQLGSSHSDPCRFILIWYMECRAQKKETHVARRERALCCCDATGEIWEQLISVLVTDELTRPIDFCRKGKDKKNK